MERWSILLCCVLGACWPNMELRAQSESPAPVTQTAAQAQLAPRIEDAALHDVAFVDREQGWAVGEHGTIWHTTDGGQNWLPQNSSVNVDLHGVWFASRDLGWAVGGTTKPYLWTSQATVLRTTDGGQTWETQLALLPALERVKFFDEQRGVAWGRGSGGDPLGVFASDDGGLNWRNLAVGPTSAWWGGDFLNQHTGVVVGSAGQAARITAGDAIPLNLNGKDRNIRAVKLEPNGTGWLVGDRGLIMRTSDGGVTWIPNEVLPSDIADAVNWQAIATHGSHVWIVGKPGTVILHSPDAGQTWQGHATGQHTPLRDVTFVDETHGWAVGEMGTILATSDGGQTWQTQRRGGERAAVLMIVRDESQIPIATLAKLANSDGYRTVVHIVGSRTGRTDPAAEARLQAAITALGGTAVTRSSSERTKDELLIDLVRELRLWRPDVVIVPDETLEDSSIETAITKAADETEYPELAQQLALGSWQVKRVFTLLAGTERGTHRVQSAAVIPLTGQSLADLATVARSWLRSDFEPLPETEEFLLKASYDGEPMQSVEDLAAGLDIAPGSDCRRPLATSDTPFDPQVQRRLAEKRRNVGSIMRMSAGNPALLGQVGQMIGDLDESAAAALLLELATHFQQNNQMELAVACQELLTRRCPSDPLADQALVWLVQYYASSETAHAYRPVTTEVTNSLASTHELPTAINNVQPATALIETDEAPQSSAVAQQRFTRAAQVAEHVAHTRPLLYSEPQVRVPWAIAERKRGIPDTAERYLESLGIRFPGEAWQACGEVERWLADPSKPPPKKERVICRFTITKPQLDGKLDEPFWEKSSALTPLHNQEPSSEIRLAWDEEYLYMAVQCAKSSQHAYPTERRRRTYDADLTDHDHVRLFLDVDRDYTTYFSLAVDHRGWTHDACWHDASWNPKWFVAASSDESQWSAEAAIPWKEITPTAPKAGDAWTVSSQRILPNAASQTLGPQDFRVLIFK